MDEALAAPEGAIAPPAAPAAYQPPPPMSGGQLVGATIAVAMAGFMVILDTTIANVSVPTISGSLAVSPSQGTWVVTSYSVADAIVVPLTGWLVSRLGTVKLFVGALLAFLTLSTACGLANSLGMLVLFRVLQGVAGAPLLALSQTLLFSIYPREKLAVGQGVFAMTAIIGPILGPIFGGYISDNFSWPWIFFINVPFGLIAATAVWSMFKERETPTVRRPVDRIGLVLLVLSVGSFQLMLDKGRELDWFGSGFIIALAAIAGCGFMLLIAWELQVDNPVVDLRLFKIRNYTIGALTLALIFGVFFGSVVLVPQWLQAYQGYTAYDAGLATAPNGILAVLLAPFVAKMSGKLDLRWMVTFSLLMFCVTFLMRTNWTQGVDFFHIVWPQFLQGLAMAFFFLPLSQMSLGALNPQNVAMGAGLQNFLRTAMAAFSASLAATLWENQTIRHHAQLTEHVVAGTQQTQQVLDGLTSQGYSPDAALGVLDRLITTQAATMATVDYFAYTIPVFIGLLGLVWLAKPMRGGAMGGGGGDH